MEIYDAHLEWRNRPADERFETLADLHNALTLRDTGSHDCNVLLKSCEFAVRDGRMALVDNDTTRAYHLTNYAAGQFCDRLDVPLPVLGRLDEAVAEKVLNNRLHRYLHREGGDEVGRLLAGLSNGFVARALHGTGYSRFGDRLWDSHVTGELVEHLPPGWRNPAAFAGGSWGAPLVPSGLYASDRDMFAFFIDGGDALDLGGDDVMHAGFIVRNSEVGLRSFWLTRFWFREVCGNNIIWGADNVEAVRIAHVGDVREKATALLRAFLRSCNAGGGKDAFASVVRLSRETFVAPVTEDRQDEAVTALYKHGLLKREILAAGAHIRAEQTAPTGSAWDWLNGFTALARSKKNTDNRVDLERRASAALLPLTV